MQRLNLAAFGLALGLAVFPGWSATYTNSAIRALGPLTYRDARSGTIFYVESDGRHVAAIDRSGKVLWVRNPFEDAHLQPYRTAFPRIAYIGRGPHHYISIGYDSSQFGLLNVDNGDFSWKGQD